MAKTIKQLQKEARILKQTKANIKKENARLRSEKLKKIKSNLKETNNVARKVEKSASKAIKNISKAYGYRKVLSSNLQRQFGGVFGGSNSNPQQQGTRPVGRPSGPASYKHRSPFNGQLIPATEYYKQIRDFRRIQAQRANQVDQKQVSQLANRGIPPEQAKQIVDSRQERIVVQPQRINPNLPPEIQRQLLIQQLRQQYPQQQNERYNPYASQVPRNIPKYGRRGEFIEGDAFGKPRIKIFGDEKSFWN